jgi:hypothetical protein
MIKQQFTLYLENKPGELAKVTRLLASKRVNIEGISVSASTDIGLVQIVVDNEVTARKVLKAARLAFTTQEVALLTLRNEPGALASLVAKVSRTGTNINYVYATGCPCTGTGRSYAIISAPDLAAVERVWRNAKR